MSAIQALVTKLLLTHKEHNVIISVLEDGDDLIEKLEELCHIHNVHNGLILFGIGMLAGFEIGYYTGSEYVHKSVSEGYELIALHGTIASGGMHIHAGLAGPDNVMIGGHLVRAKVKVTAEIAIQKLEDVEMKRVVNQETGLGRLEIK